MKAIGLAAAAGVAMFVGGCATTERPRPVDVTRFHNNAAIAPGSFAIETARPQALADAPPGTVVPILDDQGPEFRTYAQAVTERLRGMGFTQATGSAAQYVVSLGFRQGSQGFVQRQSPVSIGIGGGGGNFGRRGGVGVGGGVGFPVGGGGQREVIGSELFVSIRNRADNRPLWEGRAVTQALSRTDAAQPVVQAQRLADALFQNFPGESGITTTVP